MSAESGDSEMLMINARRCSEWNDRWRVRFHRFYPWTWFTWHWIWYSRQSFIYSQLIHIRISPIATQRSFPILDSGNPHALYILIIASSILPTRSVHDHTITTFVSVLASIEVRSWPDFEYLGATSVIERWILPKSNIAPMGSNKQLDERNFTTAISVETLARRITNRCSSICVMVAHHFLCSRVGVGRLNNGYERKAEKTRISAEWTLYAYLDHSLFRQPIRPLWSRGIPMYMFAFVVAYVWGILTLTLEQYSWVGIESNEI